MPHDEIERLRAVLARVHEKPQGFLRNMLRRVEERLGKHTGKKAMLRLIESKKKKRAA